MEVKTSKVMSVQSNGSWDGKFGTMYKFEVVFQNGDVGEYSSKYQEQNKFEVGEEAEYEYTAGKYPKVKPHYSKPFVPTGSASKAFGKPSDVQDKIVRQSMLKAAVDFWAITPQLKPSVNDILVTAKKFVDWVNDAAEPQWSEEYKPSRPLGESSIDKQFTEARLDAEQNDMELETKHYLNDNTDNNLPF